MSRLTEAQFSFLVKVVDAGPEGLPLRQKDFTVSGEISMRDLAKHVWHGSRYHLHATDAGRAALTEARARDGGGDA